MGNGNGQNKSLKSPVEGLNKLTPPEQESIRRATGQPQTPEERMESSRVYSAMSQRWWDSLFKKDKDEE